MTLMDAAALTQPDLDRCTCQVFGGECQRHAQRSRSASVSARLCSQFSCMRRTIDGTPPGNASHAAFTCTRLLSRPSMSVRGCSRPSVSDRSNGRLLLQQTPQRASGRRCVTERRKLCASRAAAAARTTITRAPPASLTARTNSQIFVPLLLDAAGHFSPHSLRGDSTSWLRLTGTVGLKSSEQPQACLSRLGWQIFRLACELTQGRTQ